MKTAERVGGYDQKEAGHNRSNFDRELRMSAEWQNMDKRIEFLDREGFGSQAIYPTIGLLWEDAVREPMLADAPCRAYNTWAMETCATHRDRPFPAAHISLRDPALAARVNARRFTVSDSLAVVPRENNTESSRWILACMAPLTESATATT